MIERKSKQDAGQSAANAIRFCFRHGLPFWIMAVSLATVVYVSWEYYLSAMTSPLDTLLENIDKRSMDLTAKFNSIDLGRNRTVHNPNLHPELSVNTSLIERSQSSPSVQLQLEIDIEISKLRADLLQLNEAKAALDSSIGGQVSAKAVVLDRSRTHQLGSSSSSSRSRFVSSVRNVYRADPIIDGLEYYKPTTPTDQALSLEEISIMVNASHARKGTLEPFDSVYPLSKLTTQGRIFRYKHTYSDPCMVRYISMKYDENCGDKGIKADNIVQLLVVGVQRSGTHYTWEMLNRLGVHVHHEGVGPDGAVGWPYAVNSFNYRPTTKVGVFTRIGYAINNPKRLLAQRFHYVFHQVRHPLRVIKTIVERCQAWDKFWKFIASVKGMEVITQEQTPLTRGMWLYILWNKHIERYADLRFQGEITSPRDICRWSGFSEDKCDNAAPSQEIVEPITTQKLTKDGSSATRRRRLTSSSEPETGDRKHDLPYRGLRVIEEKKTTKTSLRDEVMREMQSRHSSSKYSKTTYKPPARVQTMAPNKFHYGNITWEVLDGENMALANELRLMCVEYGYDLDPDAVPQVHASHKFTA